MKLVAAVAGLAALAVVLVQARVEDTGERISSPNPRTTAAIHAAGDLRSDRPDWHQVWQTGGTTGPELLDGRGEANR